MRKIAGRNGGQLTILDKGDPGYANAGAPPKKCIIDEITKLMEGDGYATIEGELLDENGKRTNQMVKVRASVPNMSSAARAYAANMKKGDTRTLQIYLDRTMGKVPQPLTGADGGPISIENSIGGISDLAIEKVIEIVKNST